ncbi:MAG: SMC-Scp complex subunit ScpB [Anaerolineales bacterium]
MDVHEASTGVKAPKLGLPARVEALLFVANGPVAISQIANALGVSVRQVEKAIEQLESESQTRGISLQRSRAGLQLTTPPALATDVERFLDLESTARLTPAALEALAIIAYQEPVTRPQIESIRGVNSDSVLRTLLRHGMIDEAGRTDGPGRPILYVTTPEFLQHFGLAKLGELPPLGLETDDSEPEKAEEPSSEENAGVDQGNDESSASKA